MYPGMWDLWADTRHWEIRQACGLPARTRVRAGDPAAIPPPEVDLAQEADQGNGPPDRGGRSS